MTKKVALLVGCNYAGKTCELHGCINDVKSIKEVLKSPRFGFSEANIHLLTDDDQSSGTEQPTGENIKKRLKEMASDSEAGDLLLFYFSGHGTRGNFSGEAHNGDEEAIVPSDFNLITKFDFRIMVDNVNDKATFILISDSCHSGGLIDKEEQQIRGANINKTKLTNVVESQIVKKKIIEYHEFLNLLRCRLPPLSDYMKETFQMAASLCFLDTKNYIPKVSENTGILISGCRSEETSFDLKVGLGDNHEPHGAFTAALLCVLQQDGNTLSNEDVVMKVRKILLVDNSFCQHSCLYSDKKNVNATFLLQQSKVDDARGVDSTTMSPGGSKGVGSFSSDVLVEVTDVAVAYFRKSSELTQQKMDKWITGLDRNTESGKTKVTDVHRILVDKKGCNVEILSKFVNTIGWEVELDHDQVLALYYASKSLIKFCGWCGKYLRTVYFTCLTCFSTRNLEFNVCGTCFKDGKICPRPDHVDFLDSNAHFRYYHLAELKRSKSASKDDVREEPSSKKMNNQLEDIETSFRNDTRLSEAVKNAKKFDMGLAVSTDICTIM